MKCTQVEAIKYCLVFQKGKKAVISIMEKRCALGKYGLDMGFSAVVSEFNINE